MPTRRAILALIPGTALFPLAGCLSAPAGHGAAPTDAGLPNGGSTDDETRPSGTGGPGVSVASVDGQPDAALEIDVAVTREAATDEHPPGLRVAVTNTGEESVDLGEARAVVFAYQYAGGGTLVLLPTGGDYPAEPGCWRLSDGIAVSDDYRIRSLAPGETTSSALSLYATTGVEGGACLPVGEYRFESPYTLNRGGEKQQFTWGVLGGAGVAVADDRLIRATGLQASTWPHRRWIAFRDLYSSSRSSAYRTRRTTSESPL